MLKLVVLNTNMEYGKYLELQTRLEWLYDFHPDFFDDISPEDKKVLQEAFLYDTPDEEYPDSIEDFFNTRAKDDLRIQQRMLVAVRALYDAAGAGDLTI